MMNLYIHSVVQLLVKFNMADLKGHLIAKKSGDMIRDRVRILYLLFLWTPHNPPPPGFEDFVIVRTDRHNNKVYNDSFYKKI